jgi:hypothetical protein
MTTAATVSNEARLRPRFALVALLGGALLFASLIIQSAGPQTKVSELTVQLLVTNQRAGLEIIGAVVSGFASLALAATLAFLFTAAKARKPQMSQATKILVLAGAVLAAAGGIGYGVIITSKASEFATHGLQTYPEANALLSGGPVAVLQYVGLVGSLLLAIGFVLIALNALRVGLITKFVGYVGIGAAAASLLLIGSPIGLFVEIIWLLSMAYLLSGRWPSGDPPAWKAGEAVPWPTAAEIREQRAQQRGGQAAGKQRGGPAPKRGASRPQPVATNSGGANSGGGNSAGANGASSGARSPAAKRKRKRRK